MALLKGVLIIIYVIVDAVFIYDWATDENGKDKKRRFNLYLDNLNDGTLYCTYVN